MKTIDYINKNELFEDCAVELCEDISLDFNTMSTVEKRNPRLKFTYDKDGIYDIEFSDGNSLRKTYMINNPNFRFEYHFTNYLKNENGKGDIIQFFEYRNSPERDYIHAIICGHTGKLLYENPGEEWIYGKFAYIDNGTKKDAFIVLDEDPSSGIDPKREGLYNFDGEAIIPFGNAKDILIQSLNPLMITAKIVKGNQPSLRLTLFDSEGKMYYKDDISSVKEISNGRLLKIFGRFETKLFDCIHKKEIDLGGEFQDAYVFDVTDEKGSCAYMFAFVKDFGTFKIFKSSKNGEFLPYDSKDVPLRTLESAMINMEFINSISHSPMKGILYTPLKNKNFYWSNILMSDGSKISDVDFKIADINNINILSQSMMGTDCSPVIFPVEGDKRFTLGSKNLHYESDTDYFPFHFILYEGSNKGNEKWNVLDVSRMKMVFDEPLDGVRGIHIVTNYFICLKRGSKYNLMIGKQSAVPNGHTPVEFEDYLISDEWFDGIYEACDKYNKASRTSLPDRYDPDDESLLVKKGSDYYFVGPFITGEIFLKCDGVDILSPNNASGRVIRVGDRNLISEYGEECVDEGVMGRYNPYCILGDFDEVYDIDLPFQILEKDGKMAIFYTDYKFVLSTSIENGNVDLDEFLIPYVSQDEGEEIYWFEDIGEMKYTNENKNFECEVKIDGEWKLLKH